MSFLFIFTTTIIVALGLCLIIGATVWGMGAVQYKEHRKTSRAFLWGCMISFFAGLFIVAFGCARFLHGDSGLSWDVMGSCAEIFLILGASVVVLLVCITTIIPDAHKTATPAKKKV